MPSYTFECKSCGHRFDHICKIADRDKVTCNFNECGGETKQIIVSPNRVQSFMAGYYEHFTKTPIYIGSKRDLKDASERYNMGSVYLDDM